MKTASKKQAITQLAAGAVGVMPTDTVYGLVASATNESAVKRLYSIKNRESKPGTVIAANIEQLTELGIPRRYLKAVEQFWPNPLSIIIPTTQNLSYLHLGKYSLALRIPSDKLIQDFLKQSGPLLTTSANQPSELPAATVEQAEKYFGNMVDFYVDGGDLSNRKPSTIIRVVDDAVEVVREGALKIDERGIMQP